MRIPHLLAIVPTLLPLPALAEGDPVEGESTPAPDRSSGDTPSGSGDPTPAPQPDPSPTPEPSPSPAPPPSPQPSPAQPTAASPATAPRAFVFQLPAGAPPISFKVGGKYALWILNQHGFLLGDPAAPLDDADYAVQMLRVSVEAGLPWFGAAARFDAAQGWWGVDNEPDVQNTTSIDAEGNVQTVASYNTYKLFGNKDTNYTIHFDHGYAWFAPPLPFGLRLQVGRQPLAAGHRLVLDENIDGVTLTITPTPTVGLAFAYAMVSEGLGSYKNPVNSLLSDTDPWKDAHLLGGSLSAKLGPITLGGFGYAYVDRSGAGTATFFPQGQGTLGPRFHPQISELGAFGFTADGALKLADGLRFEFELDGLVGKDKIANTDHAAGLLDKNDGTLRGWNLYLKVDQGFAPGPTKLRVGGTLGLGSGDEDVTRGPGNVNKISTMGFFAFTNLWEDSVATDIEGISPQGFGSPVARGYREFENTIAVQGRFGFDPAPPLGFDFSYTRLVAMRPIHAFSAAGAPLPASSRDIGHEVDVDVVVRLLPKVSWQALFGVFIPRAGAGYLIRGSRDTLEPAWELKQSFEVGF